MKDSLSPATRAVDRAIADRIQLLGEIAPSRQIAAAALRAAAYEIDWESGDPKFLLKGIADELEGYGQA